MTMASWNDINNELRALEDRRNEVLSPLDEMRAKYITELAQLRDRNVICYYSGWLQSDQALRHHSINDDDMNGLMNAVHGLDRDKGLDLVLHTPGGDLAATEAIVHYLLSCFKSDVVAIVPQMAMSAGTMVACACKEIIMGRQSSLGPTDPQFGGAAAGGVLEEFDKAVEDAKLRPESIPLWSQIISKYPPTFLGDCQKAVDASKAIVGNWLRDGMFSDDTECDEKVAAIVDKLCLHQSSGMHNRHFSYDELSSLGMRIKLLEDDDALQDAVLSVHHAFMTAFQRTPVTKIIESSCGKRWIISSGG